MADRVVLLIETDDEGMFRFTTPMHDDIGSNGYGILLAEAARGISTMIARAGGYEQPAVLDSIAKAMLRELAFPVAEDKSPPAVVH